MAQTRLSDGEPICSMMPSRITTTWSDIARLFEVVRHVDRRDAETVLQLAQLHAHVGAQLGVEVRQRLVEQQHRWLEHEGARERHALLLPAGKL